MSEGLSPGRVGYERLRHFLKESDWVASEQPDQFLFIARRESELCPLTYYFRVAVDRCQFLFYIVPEIEVPDYAMASAAEYLCRVNSGMRIGNFELDFGNRHVRFKSSVNFTGADLTDALIAGAIEPAVQAFDEYFDGLARVLAGVATPIQAINAIDYAT